MASKHPGFKAVQSKIAGEGYSMDLRSTGYGQFNLNGYPEKAHRVAWLFYRGEIPAGQFVLHKCDTPICVNPDHLYLGTHLDNAKDRCERGRSNTAFGEKQGSAKLTSAQVIEIFHSSDSRSQLAKRYSVHPNTIYAIKTKKKWRHLHAYAT